MVQTQKAVKQDHNVIRQLLSTGAIVPPPSVFKVTSDSNKQDRLNPNIAVSTVTGESPVKQTTMYNKEIDNSNKCSSILKVLELAPFSSKDCSEFSDIDASSELFPEIGFPLVDLDDIDQMVTLDIVDSDDLNKDMLSIGSETVIDTDNVDVINPVTNSENNCYRDREGSTNEVTMGEMFIRESPMQISSSSDSEVSSPISPFQHKHPSSATMVTQEVQDIEKEDSSEEPMAFEAGNIPIPLTALALVDEAEEAQESKLILQQLEEKYPAACSSSDANLSDANLSDEEEVTSKNTTRRKWTQQQSTASLKRQKNLPSVSSEQDDDFDEESDEEDYGDGRLEKRRYNNRVAAQRCRQRKRQYYLSLTKEIQEWECNNTSLKYEIHTLQKDLQSLQGILQQHQQSCSVNPAQLKASSTKSKKKSKKRARGHKHRH